MTAETETENQTGRNNDEPAFIPIEVWDAVFSELAASGELIATQPPAPVAEPRPVAAFDSQVASQPRPRTRTAPCRPQPEKPDHIGRVMSGLCGLGLLVALTMLAMPALFSYTWSPFRDTELGKAATEMMGTGGGVKTKAIQDVKVGDRLVGRNPIREQVEGVEPDPATWRKISLYMAKESGLGLWIDLLRPLTWIEEHDARPGSTIFIDLYEMGAVGDAEVTYVGPCPPIQPGQGTVVTGTFKHQADENTEVVNLKLEDQIELTGVTANHPYWSEDRQDFIEVGKLRTGELVDTEYGLKHVVSVTPIAHDGFLYNLETTEHVYRVGSLGTLVHNFCVHRITPDAQGRVRSALAHITPADLGTGTATNSATRAAARALGNSTDDAGHLIGRLLGGPGGKRSGNFFAQNPHINRGQFAQLEQRVAGFVRNGDDVWIRVTPQYAGNGTRATGVLYQVRVNGQTIISQLFGN